MDVRIILTQLRAGCSDRQVTRDTGVARDTVRRYRAWARGEGLLEGELPMLGELHRRLDATLPRLSPPQNRSTVDPYREIVVRLRQEGVEMCAIHTRIKERGYAGSYSSVHRFVRALEQQDPLSDATVCVERPPGDEAQVDFGSAGYMRDSEGRVRKAWAFVMVLSYSRHQYVEFVFDQSTPTWLGLHTRAFAFFGGCPARVITDNLKAAIVKAAWHDPQVNLSYGELAQHYGFLIAPCRPRTPGHKGKVEAGVHYVKRNFLGGRTAMHGTVAPDDEAGVVAGIVVPTGPVLNIDQANRDVLAWCWDEAGRRCHGTTRDAPLERFVKLERAALKPLPENTYDLSEFRRATLHRDCHLVFDNCQYSAPCQLIGQKLWVRGGMNTVRIYDDDHQLLATHERSRKPGTRLTNMDHMPPFKLPGLLVTRETVLAQAHEVGPCTHELVAMMLDDTILDKMYTAARLVRLGQSYGYQRLEAACQRACSYEEISYKTVKGILEKRLDIVSANGKLPSTTADSITADFSGQTIPQRVPGIAAVPIFARSDEELVARLVAATPSPQGGDETWQ